MSCPPSGIDHNQRAAQLVCALLFAGEVRPEDGTVLRRLRDAGAEGSVRAISYLADLAAHVVSFLGVDHVVAKLKPEEKTGIVEAARGTHRSVIMVGDEVDNAPALAAADMSVAMGARGAAAPSEAADVVIVLDRLKRATECARGA